MSYWNSLLKLTQWNMRTFLGNALARCTCMPIAHYLLSTSNLNSHIHIYIYINTHVQSFCNISKGKRLWLLGGDWGRVTGEQRTVSSRIATTWWKSLNFHLARIAALSLSWIRKPCGRVDVGTARLALYTHTHTDTYIVRIAVNYSFHFA